MLLTITTTAGNSHLVSLLFEFFPTGFLIGVIYSKIQDIHSLKYYMCSECKYNEYQRFVQAFTNLFITIFPLNSLGITADIHFKYYLSAKKPADWSFFRPLSVVTLNHYP